MAKDADYGLMIWDAKSAGTLSNLIELLIRSAARKRRDCGASNGENGERPNFLQAKGSVLLGILKGTDQAAAFALPLHSDIFG